MAGYSKQTLVQKLGIKEGHRLSLLNAPDGYLELLGQLPDRVRVCDSLVGTFDFIQFFTADRAELSQMFPRLREALARTGMLWVSWPKKSARVPTDLTEDVIREIGLNNGLVDVKVAAVDETWSGLKFVYRLRDRQ